MNADLESALLELAQDATVEAVPAPDVEGGAEAALFLEVRNLHGEAKTIGSLDVVREDERRAVCVRPKPLELSLGHVTRSKEAETVEADKPDDILIKWPRWELGW